MKNIIKKILAIWISIYLIIVPPFAHAASAGGWSFSAFDVATSVVTALKNGASASVAVAKSPISQKIGKGILGGVIAGAAIPLAISQLSGIALEAVDWVLDPENNAIKYREKTSAKMSYYRGGGTYMGDYSTHEEAAKEFCRIYGAVYASYADAGGRLDVNCTSFTSSITYDSSSQSPDWTTIPIGTVADKVYDNAKTDAASASVVNDAVRDYVNEGSADVALDAAKADADATHGCGTGTHWSGSACVADTTTTPDTPTTDTPFDPTDIIDAIGKVFDAVMSLPDVINNALDDLLADIKDFFQPVIDSVTNFFEWVKTTYDEFVKPDDSPTNVDVDVPQTQTIDTDISFGGSCPANVDIEFGLPGHTVPLTLMDWSKFCMLMDKYLKPIVIAIASYQAIRILGGQRESG